MTTPAVLSLAVPADAPSIASLHAICFEDEHWELESVRWMLTQVTTLCIVCRQDAALAGFALCRVAADECEVLSCAVRPQSRACGFGRQMLTRAFALAAGRGARRAFLEVDEGNACARALYESLGLRKVGRRRGYYVRPGRPPADALVMSADL